MLRVDDDLVLDVVAVRQILADVLADLARPDSVIAVLETINPVELEETALGMLDAPGICGTGEAFLAALRLMIGDN